jgi:hypothetical protein
MRTTLAFLGVAVPALLFLGWNLGWYNIVRGSSTITHSRTEADTSLPPATDNTPGHRTANGNENDNVNFMQPDTTVPIPRPYLRSQEGPSFPR